MLNKITIALLFTTLLAFYACKDKLVDNPLGNKPPTTKVFLTPDSTISQQQSRIDLFWSGDDPDGTIVGFYFSWNDTNWTFTTKNDSLFSLQIGAVDKIFHFKVSAVDNSGNGVYDTLVSQNGRNYGHEPFTDLNGNGKWDQGEPFIDIGLIDPNPASLAIPIKNTAPTISWNALSFHPDISFPVMTFGWNASDIDGDGTIQYIRIALNDTNNFVSIDGSIRTITIRPNDLTSSVPIMDILINGDQNNQPIDPSNNTVIKLPGLIYNSNNIFYCQSVDISGAKSAWLSSKMQPAPSKPDWYVQKPKGKILIVDDYKQDIPTDKPSIFYAGMMDSLQLTNQYDVYDIYTQKPPYLNITFYETIKLFQCLIWYSDNDPSLDLANVTVQKYTNLGKKIFFSLQFPQAVDLTQVQGFLPITPDSAAGFQPNLLSGRTVSDTSHSYPQLKTSSSLIRSRAFWVSGIGIPIYYFADNATFPRNKLVGYMGFKNSQNSIFFIGLPLHLSNGIPGSVQNLLHKVLKEDFNIIP